MTASPDWESLLWEARGYLGLDDDEAVPREELIEQAVANGYQEREVQQAIRNADVLELAGDLDDPRVQLAADAEHDERHHSADDKPNGDLQTAEEDLEDEPLSVTEDGLWLPKRFAAASRLIVRTPTKTVDSRLKGDWDQRRLATGITVDDWDSDYLDGEGRTAKIRNEKCLPDGDGPKVGLMIEGEDQRWFPVDVDGGESA